jgi:hypothetical protein
LKRNRALNFDLTIFCLNGFDVRKQQAFRLALVAMVSVAFGISPAFGQLAHLSVTNAKAAEVSAANAKTMAKAQVPLACPRAGLLPLPSGSPGTGDHTVTLSWNASETSANSKNGAIGYCLYRSKKQSAAHKNPTCATCERVNATPVTSLSCMDDLVEDGATYYYVVTAINGGSRISSSSNEVKVPIQADHESRSVSGNSPPFCRATLAAK